MTGKLRPEPLTERQREVLDLLARGRTNAQIAEALGISLDGAKWHVSEVIGRLGVTSREEAAMVWRMERRPLRRMRGWVMGLVASIVGHPASAATAGIAAVAVAATVWAVLGYVSGEEPTPDTAAIPMPSLPPHLANPTTPTLVYVDVAFTEAPAPLDLVTFDVISGTEVSREPLEGVRGDIARLGNSLLGLRDNALVQFDLNGVVFRVIYKSNPMSSFALSSDNTRAVLIGNDEAMIVDLATGDVRARVTPADFVEWPEGARFGTPAWVTSTDPAWVPLNQQDGFPTSWPGYVLFGEADSPQFYDTAGYFDIARDGSMLLETDRVCRLAVRLGFSTLPPAWR